MPGTNIGRDAPIFIILAIKIITNMVGIFLLFPTERSAGDLFRLGGIGCEA